VNKTRKIEISVEIIRILSAIAISYGIALLTLIVISSDPLFIVKQFVLGPLTSLRRIGSIISLAVPFTFTGLCFCFMYAVNKFNLAGEGIFMLSGCIATWVALTLGNTLNPILTILIILIIGAAAGIVVNGIPAILDLKFNANIVVVSLMLNSVLVFFTISKISTYLLFSSSFASKSTISAFAPATLSFFCITPGRTVAI